MVTFHSYVKLPEGTKGEIAQKTSGRNHVGIEGDVMNGISAENERMRPPLDRAGRLPKLAEFLLIYHAEAPGVR